MSTSKKYDDMPEDNQNEEFVNLYEEVESKYQMCMELDIDVNGIQYSYNDINSLKLANMLLSQRIRKDREKKFFDDISKMFRFIRLAIESGYRNAT
jgi:hypothetical protein